MIHVYTIRKGSKHSSIFIKWCKSHNIDYKVTLYKEMTRNDILNILSVADNGFKDLLISRSPNKQMMNILNNFDNLSFEEGVQFLLDNPTILTSLLVSNGKKLMRGFSEDECLSFLPKELKRQKRLNVIEKLHKYEDSREGGYNSELAEKQFKSIYEKEGL